MKAAFFFVQKNPLSHQRVIIYLVVISYLNPKLIPKERLLNSASE